MNMRIGSPWVVKWIAASVGRAAHGAVTRRSHGHAGPVAADGTLGLISRCAER
jgi:ribosomal protein L35AE/L33A